MSCAVVAQPRLTSVPFRDESPQQSFAICCEQRNGTGSAGFPVPSSAALRSGVAWRTPHLPGGRHPPQPSAADVLYFTRRQRARASAFQSGWRSSESTLPCCLHARQPSSTPRRTCRPYPFVDQRLTVSVVDLTTFASSAEMITFVLLDAGSVDTGNVALVAPAGTGMLLET